MVESEGQDWRLTTGQVRNTELFLSFYFHLFFFSNFFCRPCQRVLMTGLSELLSRSSLSQGVCLLSRQRYYNLSFNFVFWWERVFCLKLCFLVIFPAKAWGYILISELYPEDVWNVGDDCPFFLDTTRCAHLQDIKVSAFLFVCLFFKISWLFVSVSFFCFFKRTHKGRVLL